MRITKKTKLSDLLPFFSFEEVIKEIYDKVPEKPLEKSLFSLTVREFIEATDKEYYKTYLKPQKRFKRVTVFEAFGKLKSYFKELEAIQKFLKQNEIKLTDDIKQAQRNVIFPSFAEDILLTLSKHFNKPTSEIEDMPISEYFLLYKQTSANNKFQQNYNRIIEQKLK